MIERYTIKFAPAVSQKELEKLLNAELTPHQTNSLSLMRARIDLVGDFEDVRKVKELLMQLLQKDEL